MIAKLSNIEPMFYHMELVPLLSCAAEIREEEFLCEQKITEVVSVLGDCTYCIFGYEHALGHLSNLVNIWSMVNDDGETA